MFHPEPNYTAMECRPNPKDCTATSGMYLLKDEDNDADSEDEDNTKEVPVQSRRPAKSLKCILAITIASVFVVGVAVAILVLVITALTTLPRDASSFVTQDHFPTILPTTVTPECGDSSNAVVCLSLNGDACRTMLVGTEEDGVYAFKGIPYALPPTSNRRWKQPLPWNASCSNADEIHPIYAQSFGNKCLQLSKDGTGSEGSEDCLFLNIWTPSLNQDAGLHVMVYFHGGGLISGSGHENGAIPTSELVISSNMVFVTFNYRLNAFGFMALEALEVDGAAGNYGFMDQILALRWIQENIRDFGGSPDKVTVFGQGSGSTSIYALLASDHATGLFHRAWLASPSPKLESSLREAYEQNIEFLNKTECHGGKMDDQLFCLLNLSAEKVLQSVPWSSWKNLNKYSLPKKTEKSPVIAVIDGLVLKYPPLTAWKMKKFNDVPLLIGTTAQETDVYPMNDKIVDWSRYDNYVYQLMLQFEHVNISEVLAMYGHIWTPEHSLSSMVSDMRVTCPVDEMVKVAANASFKPVYRYITSFSSEQKSEISKIQKNYAYSGIDMDAFFNFKPETTAAATHWNDFANTMRHILYEFVHNDAIDIWNTFPHSTYNVSITAERIAPRFQSVECNFWRTNWFFPIYAWVN